MSYNPFSIKLVNEPTNKKIMKAFKANNDILRVINPSMQTLIECSIMNTLFFQKCLRQDRLDEDAIIKVLMEHPWYITMVERPSTKMQNTVIYLDVSNFSHISNPINDDDTAFYLIENIGYENFNCMQKTYIKREIRDAYLLAKQFKAGNYCVVEKKLVNYVARFLNWDPMDLYIYTPY